MLFNQLSLMATVLLSLTVTPAFAQDKAQDDIVRHTMPGSSLPIARAVEVSPALTTIYLSGAVPPVIDEAAEKTSIGAYGNTETQTIGVLKSIEATLKSINLTLADVVKMQVFLVGEPTGGGKMDFEGFMKGYSQFFGTQTQPNLPSRSVMQVAGLVNPGWLVEIEVTAVR